MSLFHTSNPYIRTSLLRDGRASRFHHSAFPLFSGCFSYEYWKYYTISFSEIECVSLKKLCEANACRVTNFLSNKSLGLNHLPCTFQAPNCLVSAAVKAAQVAPSRWPVTTMPCSFTALTARRRTSAFRTQPIWSSIMAVACRMLSGLA